MLYLDGDRLIWQLLTNTHFFVEYHLQEKKGMLMHLNVLL